MFKKSKKTIIVSTQYFAPEKFQINDLCIWLSKTYKVIVIAPEPSYPSFRDIKYENLLPLNKNIRIIRLPVFKRNGSLLGFFLNQISYLLASIPCTVLYTIINKPKYIITPQYSPFSSILPAFFSSFFSKSNLKVWVFDLWPESLKVFRKKNILFKIVYSILIYFTRNILFRFNEILISSPKFKSSESLRGSKRITILNTWEPQKKAYKNIAIGKESKKIIISSVGNIGNAHDLELLKNFLYVISSFNIKINFAGGGSKFFLLKEYVKNKKLSNVKFYDYVSQIKAKYLISRSHFTLIPFKKSEISDTIPYRFVTSLAFSTPLISFNDTFVSNIIQENKIGFAYKEKFNKIKKEDNFYLIEKFISNIYSQDLSILSLNAADFFNKNYSSTSSNQKLMKIFC